MVNCRDIDEMGGTFEAPLFIRITDKYGNFEDIPVTMAAVMHENNQKKVVLMDAQGERLFLAKGNVAQTTTGQYKTPPFEGRGAIEVVTSMGRGTTHVRQFFNPGREVVNA